MGALAPGRAEYDGQHGKGRPWWGCGTAPHDVHPQNRGGHAVGCVRVLEGGGGQQGSSQRGTLQGGRWLAGGCCPGSSHSMCCSVRIDSLTYLGLRGGDGRSLDGERAGAQAQRHGRTWASVDQKKKKKASSREAVGRLPIGCSAENFFASKGLHTCTACLTADRIQYASRGFHACTAVGL